MLTALGGHPFSLSSYNVSTENKKYRYDKSSCLRDYSRCATCAEHCKFSV